MAKTTQQGSLMLILVIVLGVAGGYIYYINFLPAQPLIPAPAIPANDTLKNLDGLTINFSILDNPKYKSLQVFGESPVSPGLTGKKDIFAPF